MENVWLYLVEAIGATKAQNLTSSSEFADITPQEFCGCVRRSEANEERIATLGQTRVQRRMSSVDWTTQGVDSREESRTVRFLLLCL